MLVPSSLLPVILVFIWKPLSHMDYWGDEAIITPTVDGIVRLYRSVNSDG